jgi:hypothetical protein
MVLAMSRWLSVSSPTEPRQPFEQSPCASLATAQRPEHARPWTRRASTGRRRQGCGGLAFGLVERLGLSPLGRLARRVDWDRAVYVVEQAWAEYRTGSV